MSISLIDRQASLSPWRARPVAEKALLALGFMIVAVVVPPWPGAALVALVVLALTFGAARVPLRLWLGVAALPLGFMASGAVVVLLQLGPGGIGLAPNGVQEAAALCLRAMAATFCLLLLALTTPAADLMAGLRRLGLPAEIVEIALLTYRFIFLLGESAVAMTHAQDARLGHRTRRLWLRSTGRVIAGLLPRAMDRARRLETGLAARGWSGEMRVLSDAPRASRPMLVGIAALQLAVLALGWMA